MPSDRTFVTELATALGMIGEDDVSAALARRPAVLANLTGDDWDRLGGLWRSRAHDDAFVRGFENGRAFLNAPDALAGRNPRLVEWTGGRRPPGDEVVPADLRVDHVYLVSCKYLSRIVHNPSPARLVEGLLAQTTVADRTDWYRRVAPEEHDALYRACVAGLGSAPDFAALPDREDELDAAARDRLSSALDAGWPSPAAADAYVRMCEAVAERSAVRWRAAIGERGAEALLWRLLRIGSAPYFILGASDRGSIRLRIGTPWDWRQAFRLRRLEVKEQQGGQPRMHWKAAYVILASGEEADVAGHVEIRWSHGRFRQPPEAKVYLDTPHEEVPGYHALDAAAATPSAGGASAEAATAASADEPSPRLWPSEADREESDGR